MAKILIIDDDIGLCKVLSRMMTNKGHDVQTALAMKQGLTVFQSQEFDVVFLDVNLPDGNGLKMVSQMKKKTFSPEIIIITGIGDRDGAESAIRSGAWDYLVKPISIQRLELTLKRVLQYRESYRQKTPLEFKLEGVKSRSPLMKECMKTLAHAALGDANVLITGETGTGKDFLARALHNNSLRARNNFVLADCAALPGTLVESLLFGSEKGAFTDAKQYRVGLVEQADKGSLFLDEIGELPLVNQKTFLNVLDTHQFRPIGSPREIQSDFRLISATNKNLKELVEQNLFREDLFYRLHAFSIVIPPLRECPEDIEPLAFYQMRKVCERMRLEPKTFSSDFFEFCACYDWPGNIRELFNTLETMIFQTPDEPTLFPKHLPEHIRVKVTRTSLNPKEKQPEDIKKNKNTGTDDFLSFQAFKTTTLEQAQKKYFLELMLFTGGDINKACRVSGLSRSGIYNFLKKHHITRTGWVSPGGRMA